MYLGYENSDVIRDKVQPTFSICRPYLLSRNSKILVKDKGKHEATSFTYIAGEKHLTFHFCF